MPQLTYNLVPPVGREGMLAAYNEGEIIIPRLAQGLVPVGKLCAPGTDSMTGPPLTTVSQNSGNPGQVKALPAGITDNPILGSQWAGVPIYDATREPYDSTLGYSCYADKAQVPVLIRGQLYVTPENVASVTQGGAVYVRVAPSGAFQTLGTFSPIAGTGLVLFPQGRFFSGPIQSSLAIIYFQF